MNKISWTDKTWNPITGCDPISPGCAHCYAQRMAKRLAGRCGYPEAPHEFDVTLHPERLDEPLKWKTPRRVFVCSMSDLFHNDVPDNFIEDAIDVATKCPQHTFQLLTKRSVRMAVFFKYNEVPKNMWVGVTVENQNQIDRVYDLLQINAAVRFVSVEPMLGPVTLPGGLDWAICGGESGPDARPLHPEWVRSLRDQCIAAGVPFHFKQWGEWYPNDERCSGYAEIHREHGDSKHVFVGDMAFARVGRKAAGCLLDGREWKEFPEW